MNWTPVRMRRYEAVIVIHRNLDSALFTESRDALVNTFISPLRV